jgi:hypothetical protein
MQGYESFLPAELGTDICKCWTNQEDQFSLFVCTTVRVFFSVQAASSKSEIIFSSAGNTVTLLQSRLDAEKDNLIIVKLNVNF